MDLNAIEKKYILANIEEIKAQYLDKDFIIEPTYFNYRLNFSGRRFYLRLFGKDNYKIAPSFSAVSRYCEPTPRPFIEWQVKLGKEKADWILTYSAAYGTFLHIVYGRILRREKLSLNIEILFTEMEYFTQSEDIDFKELKKWYKEQKRDIRKDLFGFVTFCKDYKVKPIAIEYPLMSLDGRLAGTADLICKITIPLSKSEIKAGVHEQEVIALGDEKSTLNSFYEDNEIQLHSYLRMWNEEHPELPATMVFNYGSHNYDLSLSDRVTPYKFKDQTDSKVAYKIPYWLDLFHGDSRNKPNFKTIEFKQDAFIGMDTDLDVFEEVNPVDILTQEVEF